MKYPGVFWYDNFNRIYRRQNRSADTTGLSMCNWTAQGFMYDATVNHQLNNLRWRHNELENAMPRNPLSYKQPVCSAIERSFGATARRNGEIPDWVSDAVCLQFELSRVPLKPPVGATINGVMVDVEMNGLETFVPIGIKPENIGKNSDLGLLLRQFMRQQFYPFSTNPTALELALCKYTWINVDVGNFSRMYKVFFFF